MLMLLIIKKMFYLLNDGIKKYFSFLKLKKFSLPASMMLVFFVFFALSVNQAKAATCETAFGIGTSATSYCSFVVGTYNYISGTDSLSTWVATDPIFVVGNGTDVNNRKNALTVLKNGNVGVGVNKPANTLDVAGNIAASGSKGVLLNSQDNPLITRGWDAFTSGKYFGIGRWGLFMEPMILTIGTPSIANNGKVQFVRYNASSGIDMVTMFINEFGYVGIGNTNPTQRLEVTGNIKLSGSIVSNGDICIGKCL